MEFSEQMLEVVKALRCNFTVKGHPVSVEDVCSDTGYLPPIMRRADQLSSFCLGYGLGVSFDQFAGSKTGTRLKLDDSTPNALRLLCATDVVIEMMQTSPTRDATPLDDLLYD